MSALRPSKPRGSGVGVLLIALGALCWLLYAIQSGREQHAYAHGGAPPNYVQLEAGQQYWIAIPGGVRSEVSAGLDPANLKCTLTRPDGNAEELTLAVENSDSNATDQIASFIADTSGQRHVDCTGIGSVYVDNAVDSGTDWSGVWLVLASVLLAIGFPLTLAALRAASKATDTPSPPGSPDLAALDAG